MLALSMVVWLQWPHSSMTAPIRTVGCEWFEQVERRAVDEALSVLRSVTYPKERREVVIAKLPGC